MQSLQDTDLRLPRVALMARHTDLIEEAMQALYDGRHLLGEIAGVHPVQSCAHSELPAAMLANHCLMRGWVQASAREECGGSERR